MSKTIYLIPGVGANDKVFMNLELPGYEIVHIKWPKHKKNESLQSYVKKLVPQIKTDTQPIFMGLSFGGKSAYCSWPPYVRNLGGASH